jgi:hypothetical protein
MQLQDAFSIPRYYWFRYSQKKAGQFLSKQIFHLFDASHAEDLYQYVERTFPDHAVDL